MTSGAMKQGVPQKVLRARYFCAAQAVWNCALLLALVALLGLSARAQHPHHLQKLHCSPSRYSHAALTRDCAIYVSARGREGGCALIVDSRVAIIPSVSHKVWSEGLQEHESAPSTPVRAQVAQCQKGG